MTERSQQAHVMDGSRQKCSIRIPCHSYSNQQLWSSPWQHFSTMKVQKLPQTLKWLSAWFWQAKSTLPCQMLKWVCSAWIELLWKIGCQLIYALIKTVRLGMALQRKTIMKSLSLTKKAMVRLNAPQTPLTTSKLLHLLALNKFLTSDLLTSGYLLAQSK